MAPTTERAGTFAPLSDPAVSVIVPARDAAPTLRRTLESLRAQELEQPFEVIVVDDGSRDDTAAIAAEHRRFVTLIRNPRSEGPGAARNRGARTARAPVLAFTDADCFPTPGWLARGLEALTRADIVQGAVLPDPAAVRTPFDRTLLVERDDGFYQTANLLVRRDLFDAVGGFRDWALEKARPRHFTADRRRRRAARTPIGEDVLFAWSARRLGAQSVFAPDALVHHEVVPGHLGDEVADRWHWTRDMPGLARLVPELREAAFYRRWFFHRKTARFDLAGAGVLVALLTRRRIWLLAAAPYADWIARDAVRWGARRGAEFALGSVVIDAATLTGLVAGSFSWRSVVL